MNKEEIDIAAELFSLPIRYIKDLEEENNEKDKKIVELLEEIRELRRENEFYTLKCEALVQCCKLMRERKDKNGENR